MGKTFNEQVTDFIKYSKRRIRSIGFSKTEVQSEIPVLGADKTDDIGELAEEYEELEDLEQEVKEEKNSFWSFLTQAFRTKNRTDEISPEDLEEMEDLKEEKEELEEEYLELEEIEDEIEEKKESIFKKISNIFMAREKEACEEVIEEIAEQYTLNEDVKDAFKILTLWIQKLPPLELKNFKESEDFQKYKEVLKKYNMIK